MSFELEKEKKRKMKRTQQKRNRRSSARRYSSRSSQAARTARRANASHGRRPAITIGRKNQNGWYRECIFVVNRRKCSCTKKNQRKSGFARCTRITHGRAIARNMASPGREIAFPISR